MTIGPLARVPVDPSIAALPKADLHLHQEAMPRLERLAARRQGRSAYDWRAHARRVLDGTPPGFGRLTATVLADLVADEFVFGEIARVSREAPVLILKHRESSVAPGGGANAICNLADLGVNVLPPDVNS